MMLLWIPYINYIRGNFKLTFSAQFYLLGIPVFRG